MVKLTPKVEKSIRKNGGSILESFRACEQKEQAVADKSGTLFNKCDKLCVEGQELVERKETLKIQYYESVDKGDKSGADSAMSELAIIGKKISSTQKEIAGLQKEVDKLEPEYDEARNDLMLLCQRTGSFLQDANQFCNVASALSASLGGHWSEIVRVKLQAEQAKEVCDAE